jgi:predicted porin
MGEIRLGRDYTNSFSTVAAFDVYGANGFGSPINLYLGLGPNVGNSPALLGSGVKTTVRADNMIGYFLPAGLGGIYGSLQVAAGEGVKGNKYIGGRLGYAAGPIDVSAGYSETDVAAADKYKTANLGASYNFGLFKLSGFLDERKFGGLKYDTYAIGASVPLGQGEFRASYASGDAKGTGIDANNARLLGLEYIYNLSKRTALYTQYGRLENKGKSAIALNGAVSATDLAAGGFTSTGYGVGVRHSF